MPEQQSQKQIAQERYLKFWKDIGWEEIRDGANRGDLRREWETIGGNNLEIRRRSEERGRVKAFLIW